MQVWHYTTDTKLDSIYADGELKPTAKGVPDRERPALWFSSNQIWEPTANKAFALANGTPVRPLTSQEMLEMFQLVRFGIDSKLLLPWHRLRKVANIGSIEQRRLIKAARKVGSSPVQWFGSLEPIALNQLTRQNFITGKWKGDIL
jgi:hypothetical protein